MNTQHSQCRQHSARARQRGVFAIEFAAVFLIFIIMLLTIIEVSRAIYMWNTLQEVTRRAARDASTSDFSSSSAMDDVRRGAVFDKATGKLTLGAPVSDKHILIDYMALQDQSDGSMKRTPIPSGSLPACPARNRLTCTGNAGSPSCIRFVRVRVCKPGTDCEPVPYEVMFSLIKLPLTLPVSETIVKAESLGYIPGAPRCN
jgi:hypothetical protein